MILGRGTAQTDEEIAADYRHMLEQSGHLRKGTQMFMLVEHAPETMKKRIGKPIAEWTDQDILELYGRRSKSVQYAYSVFVCFLFFRGYRQASIELLGVLPTDLCRQWDPYVAVYRQKIEQTNVALKYRSSGPITTVLLWLLAWTRQPLEEITRSDFEAFREAYQSWYRQWRKGGKPSNTIFRLEQCLIHWGILTPAPVVVRHEEYIADLIHAPIRAVIDRFVRWCNVKYRPSTIFSSRFAVIRFFQWLQEHYPSIRHVKGVTRSIALEYGQWLKQQHNEGQFGLHYCIELHTKVRLFYNFLLDEQDEEAPTRNPFSVKDMPKKPQMLPRYLTDQDIRLVLDYCHHSASLLERTLIITLLHTGIRAAELANLKVGDIVQIQGKWKLHIREGKGLKDRMIPLTAPCLAVLQEWQEQGWERTTDRLFSYHGRPWKDANAVCDIIRQAGKKAGVQRLTPHRFRHSFATALLNYGMRESALQKLMGHATVNMTIEYARILDQSVEKSFAEALSQMQDGALSWVPNFFTQEEYTTFVEGDSVSWIQLPLGFCRRNPKLHCESDVKCFLCERFYATPKDLPRLQQMYERFTKLGLKLKADVVAAQIQQIQRQELSSREATSGFIPAAAISVTRQRR